MFQEREQTLQGFFVFLDAVCIAVAFGVALGLKTFHESLPLLGRIPHIPWVVASRSDYVVLFFVNLLTWLFYVRRSGLYRRITAGQLDRVLLVYSKAITLAILATGTVAFALKISPSRLFFGYFFVCEFVFLFAKQGFAIVLLRRIRSSLGYRRHALVIGAQRAAAWFATVIRAAHHHGYELVGLLVVGEHVESEDADLPVVGSLEDLDRVLRDYPVEEVFIVGAAQELSGLAGVAQTLIEKGRIVSIVSTLGSGKLGVAGRITNFDGIPVISYGPMPKDEFRSGVKRAIDIAFSFFALVLCSPVLLSVAAAIKLFDPGPVLFRQERLGAGGHRFSLIKFRTMRADAERVLRSDAALYKRYVENDFKLPAREDPRVSRLGRFLRRSSLDELPQLWNVLKGDMALVGPRPIVPAEIEKYGPYGSLFLAVRPGLTGRWQVSGRSAVPYPERAYIDLDYIGGHSIREDLGIILRTVPSVLRRRGAH